MGVSGYHITSAALREERRKDYELSILTGMDSFAYTIRDRSSNELLAYHSYDFDRVAAAEWSATLNKTIESDRNLRGGGYGKTILGWDGAAVTLVPDDLFDPESAGGYLESLTVIGLEDEVRQEALAPIGNHLIYLARREHLHHLEATLDSGPTLHYAGALLTTWAARSRRLDHGAVSCCIRGGRLFVAGHKRGKLCYFNTFYFTNSQDALYYLLLAFDQSDLSPAKHSLYLCGEILTSGELYGQFYRYVEDIRFCQYGAPPTPASELAELPAHLYFDLLCLR